MSASKISYRGQDRRCRESQITLRILSNHLRLEEGHNKQIRRIGMTDEAYCRRLWACFTPKKPRCRFGASGAVSEVRDCQIENDSRSAWRGSKNRSTKYLSRSSCETELGKIGKSESDGNETNRTYDREISGDNPHFYFPTKSNFPVERLKC